MSGTTLTIGDAAKAIATEQGGGANSERTLCRQMMDAARDGSLTVRHPHSGLPYRPDPVRDFYELVTPDDVNDWLARQGASYRWRDAGRAEAEVSTRPDYAHARALELWTLVDASYWLTGRSPRTEAEFLAEDRDAGGSVGQRYRAIEDSTLAGSLPFIEVDGAYARRRVKPADAVAWAKARNIEVPAELSELAATGKDSAPEGAGARGEVAPSRRHTTRGSRRDALSPVIDNLMRDADDPSDRAALWSGLLALANKESLPPPLLGIAEGEVKWRGDDGDPKFLPRKAFMQRLNRITAKRRTAKDR